MNQINTNRKPWEIPPPSFQIQRLKTYNTLVRDLLRELVDLTEPDLSDTHNECLKKCEKALATKEQS